MKFVSADWGHLEESWSVYDGKKFTKKLPPPKDDLVILTENMPEKYAEPYIKAGAKILRCSPTSSSQYREENDIEKSHDNDARVIYDLYQASPAKFREMRLSPPLNSYYHIFKDLQEVRMRTANRLRDGMGPTVETILKAMQKSEDEAKKVLTKDLKNHRIYTEWLETIKGMGPALAGGLIAYTGDIARFNTVSSLWAYVGYKVVDGHCQKKKTGETANWHHDFRSLCWNIMDQFIKQRTPVYRELYDTSKAKYLARGEWTLGHVEKAARRAAVKIFLSHYWNVYRQIAGLPVTKPWVLEHGGHADYIPIPNWAA